MIGPRIALLFVALLAAPAHAAPAPPVGPARPLTEPALDAHRPRFSPDARTLVFHAGPDGKGDIYRIGVDGAGLSRLTTDPGDDRDPAFTRDGAHIVWSAVRGGARDLYIMGADGSDPRRLVALEGDEFEPAPSPIKWLYLAVNHDDCSGSGAEATIADRFEKIAFTRVVKGRPEVWFVSPDGRHLERLSAKGEACRAPAWSNSGLELAWTCKDKGASVREARASWDLTFADALKAIGWDGEKSRFGTGCEEDPEVAKWEEDACLAKLPRRYARFDAKQRSEATAGLADPTWSHNRALLLANGANGVRTLDRTSGAWSDLPLPGARSASWSPDGARVAFETAGDGGSVIAVADTSFYLQDVRDLADFPELLGKGASDLMQKNGFVARPGTEKEMFAHYEKVRYAWRAPFITTDAVLQAFHDETSGLLREAEGRAQTELLALCDAALAHVLARHAERPSPSRRWLAVVLGVGRTFLAAGEQVQMPSTDAYVDPEETPEPAPPSPTEQLPELARAEAATLPEPIRDEATRYVEALLAHEGLAELPVPGEPEPVKVDMSQAKPRGHYAQSGLAGWFVAMSWFAVAPLPLDEASFELEQAMGTLGVEGGTARETWARIDALVGGFMGRPVDATLGHVRALREASPTLFEPLQQADVAAGLARLRGPVPFRGIDGALAGKSWPTRLVLFPKRYGLDVEVFKRLTHPDVPLRPFPAALDVFAALGVPRAAALANGAEKAEEWAEKYREELDGLVAHTAGLPATYWSTDLYHGWLAMLRAVASPLGTVKAAPDFARTTAWHDRQIFSALAGYAQLKHDAVLYAYQDMSVECDSMRPVLAYIEQPDLGVPKGYVDPNPQAFHAIERLAARVYALFTSGEEPDASGAAWAGAWQRPHDPEKGWPEEEDPAIVASNVRKLAARLARIAEAQVAGQPVSEADTEWMFRVGAILETLFQRTSASQGHVGQDEGRLARGVALAVDVHTNLQRAEALTLAVGRLVDLWVAVPDGVGRRMTQGAIASFYELKVPMSERLTDDEWGERLEAGKVPPLPAFTSSFLEGR